MARRSGRISEKLAPVLDAQKIASRNIQEEMLLIESEAIRVSEIMRNAPTILEELDQKFSEVTKLTKTDIKFLFIAIGLQCLRQYILPNSSLRLSSLEGDKLVENVVPKSLQEILLGSVPYDATARTIDFHESSGLSGANHRFKTLGHDPVFGWIFGPVNIITDSLTKSDIISTYSVANMKISGYYASGTIGMFNDCFASIRSDKYLLPVAVVRQALHFGSDYFTKQGLPLPVIGSLNEEFAKSLVTKFNIDMYGVTRSLLLSMLINSVIMYVHTLLYNKEFDGNQDLYEVRTRKILSYSNAISSTSNIIYVAINGFLGNTTALKTLDVGGMLVTIYRLVTDYRFIVQIKREFLEREFFNIVMN